MFRERPERRGWEVTRRVLAGNRPEVGGWRGIPWVVAGNRPVVGGGGATPRVVAGSGWESGAPPEDVAYCGGSVVVARYSRQSCTVVVLVAE